MILAVSALNVMYSSMNSPSQLKGWKSSGGDPCDGSWKGIKCSGSSVTEMYILYIPQHTVNTTFCHVIVYILHFKNKGHIRKLIL